MLIKYPMLDNPNYSFDIVFGKYSLMMTVKRIQSGYYFDLYDNKAEVYLSRGRTIKHGVNIFQYTHLPYEFYALHPDSIDDDYLNMELILDDQVQ